jgi:hypothetical protein
VSFIVLGIVFVYSVFLPPTLRADETLRCKSRIIDIGASRSEVRRKCGEPTDISRHTETRFLSQSIIDLPTGEKIRVGQTTDSGLVVTVEVEEWFYDFGPHQFTHELVFEDGRLVRITTGNHGN